MKTYSPGVYMRRYSPGIIWELRDHGNVEKCPYCPDKDIPRVSPNQITCGRAECRRKHQNAKAKVAHQKQRDAAKRRAAS